MTLFSVFGNPSTWESLQEESLPPVTELCSPDCLVAGSQVRDQLDSTRKSVKR